MTTTDTTIAEEETSDGRDHIDDEAWETLLGRLNRLSITRHFDAYTDIDWDDPEFALDPTDRRWELTPSHPLGATEWYEQQSPEIRARLGCELVASQMKTGLVFENILKRGLLEFAAALPNRAPEFRYAYHEVIEEAQHSLMFQEFVNRTGFDAAGLRWFERIGARQIVALGRRFPALFFVFVLGGEDPIDYVQRRELRSGEPTHPLLERIMRIHVTEEARHLSFARHFLKRTVPELGWFRRAQLAVFAPLVLTMMAQMMLVPSAQLVRRYGIPRAVIKSAYLQNPANRAETMRSLAKVRSLCGELGLLGRPWGTLWRLLGLNESSR